ncbi:MAG: hypothetical protein U0183_23300 [Polyangiaceae bacterium]
MSARPLAVAFASLLAVGLVAAEPARAAFVAHAASGDTPTGLPQAAPATAPLPTSQPRALQGTPEQSTVASPSESPAAPTPKAIAPRPSRAQPPRLDLRDPWGNGTLAAPTSASKGAALDLVDPWDPSRSFAPSARSERTLDPWAP